MLHTLYYHLWLNHATGKIGQKKTNTRHHLEAKLTHKAITLACLLNDYNITSGLCTAENTTVNNYWLLLQSSIVARHLLIVKSVAWLVSKNKHRHLSKTGK